MPVIILAKKATKKVAKKVAAKKAVAKKAVKKVVAAVVPVKPEPPAPPKPTNGMLPVPPRDMKKYAFTKPETVKFVPRDDFIQGVCGMLPPIEVDMATYIVSAGGSNFNGIIPANLQTQLYYMASWYQQLNGYKARLPKFTRWVTGMFPNEPRYVDIFAKLGQKVSPLNIIVSDKCEDILRAADSKHFASCFKGSKTLNDIAEKVPGMGVMFAEDDEAAQMRLRAWVLHIKDKDGKDGLGIGRVYGATQVDLKAIAQTLSMANGNCPVYQMGNYGAGGTNEDVTAVNGFAANLYFDFNCWGKSKAAKLAG